MALIDPAVMDFMLADVSDNEDFETPVGDRSVIQGRDAALFDDCGRIIIETHVTEALEFDKMMRFWTKERKSHDTVVRNLYCFLCSVAYDNIKKEDQNKMIILYPMLVTVFDEALQSLFLDSWYVLACWTLFGRLCGLHMLWLKLRHLPLTSFNV